MPILTKLFNMKIRLNTIYACPDGVIHPGKELIIGKDISADQAKQLLEGGYASQVKIADKKAKPEGVEETETEEVETESEPVEENKKRVRKK